MKNYVCLGLSRTGKWKHYVYLDVVDVLLQSIHRRDPFRIELEDVLGREEETYKLIAVKVLKKDDGKFLKAMEDLKVKMLLCGYQDYESHGEELISELEGFIREDELKNGRIQLPAGGYARPEMG